jgi:hypothetical protein
MAMVKAVVALTSFFIEAASFVIAISVSVYANAQVTFAPMGSFHDVDPSFDTSACSFSSLSSSVNSIPSSFGSLTPACVTLSGSFGVMLYSLGASRVVPSLFLE